ncbi:RagB/SusD family nutrient uptake outer membrane protein [Fulvivirga ligni]|uniref:RagB/SusD family nutrient uptake outer membrane protein n=1 Tax=Fulvivirga ligni TaxID=2904246 RepID=UPI001F3F9716|nr:RagB/SusD family nutrient uptake outer membrane protein [Fulvivirga ligni]UII24170.1 RagB/SusD family nutrient uptake outer membrane protein [Fulvivirga ligni]
MMKKIYIYLLTALTITTTSCDMDYEPEYDMVTAYFYETEEDLDAAISGAYKDFTYHTMMNHYFYQFLMGDDLSTRTGKTFRINVDAFNAPTDEADAFYKKTWREYWHAIYNVNTFLAESADAEVSPEMLMEKTAQMRFLRGYAYLVLARNFGSVPLITTPQTDGSDLRASTVDIYKLIEEDFQYVVEHSRDNYGADIGRPTTWAGKAGLTYLYISWAGWPVKDNSKYELARQYAQEIVNGPFSLDVDADGDEDTDDFAALWNNNEMYDANGESIFEFMFSAAEVESGVSSLGPMLAQGMFPEDLSTGDNAPGWQDHNAEIGFYNRYPDTDPRKEITFLTEWPSADNNGNVVSFENSRYKKPTYKKWTSIAQKVGDQNVMFRNLMVFRYADLLLLYAEAEAEVNGPGAAAYDAVNMVRSRAGVADLTPGLGKAEFIDAVLNERMLELAGEGPRFWDLQRREMLGVANASNLKDANDIMPLGDPNDPANWTFPIPQQEISLNPKLQQYFDAATMAK